MFTERLKLLLANSISEELFKKNKAFVDKNLPELLREGLFHFHRGTSSSDEMIHAIAFAFNLNKDPNDRITPETASQKYGISSSTSKQEKESLLYLVYLCVLDPQVCRLTDISSDSALKYKQVLKYTKLVVPIILLGFTLGLLNYYKPVLLKAFQRVLPKEAVDYLEYLSNSDAPAEQKEKEIKIMLKDVSKRLKQ